MSKKPVIHISNLTKKFGNFAALDKLDLTVHPGEVHGFFGPNGSGKSTTIRVLLGILKKTAGDVTLLGSDPWHDSVELHRRLAYVPGDVSFWPNLSGGEVIDLLGSLRGNYDHDRRDELLDMFQLDPTKKFRTYSKGNRQKVALVSALSADVELYIMDEPTSGLDPLMESAFQAEVIKLKQRGKTILLSSHILAEVEALCDKVTIIREGRTVETGTLSELRHLHRTTVTAELDTVPKKFGAQPGVHNVSIDGTTIEFEVDSHAIDAALTALASHHIKSLASHPPTLEELFLRHYDEEEATEKATVRS
jgi:ABC-2 type transport system ATP-binding protein